MKTRPDPARLDRLWRRYWDIANGRSPGLRLPILRHLALTNDPVAMLQLADELAPHGRPSQPFTAAGLMHRAYRRGSSIAAQNLAADAFNRSDLKAYRHWLRRAARAGDADAARELLRFETRLPHEEAGAIRRKRPRKEYDWPPRSRWR